MERRWLTIQSFRRNQGHIDHLNRLLVNYKLEITGHGAHKSNENIEESKTLIKDFLEKILNYTSENISDRALLGIDARLRTLVRSFQDAKKRKRQFRSDLFKDDPKKIIALINNPKSKEDYHTLINSLTELRSIIETHSSIDLKELIERI